MKPRLIIGRIRVGMSNEELMQEAMGEARKALRDGEVPIGCVIVQDGTGQIIGRGHNQRETEHDPTAHAEIVAMREAGAALGDWRLADCTLVVTLEPCPMCAGAMVNARVRRVVYGCGDPKAGAVRSLYRLCEDGRLNHRVQIESGILEEECADLLKEFFRMQREKGKK